MRIRPLPSNPTAVMILAATWHGPRPIRPGRALRRTAGTVEALPPAPCRLGAPSPVPGTARWTSFWRVTFRRSERSPVGAGWRSWRPIANRIAQSVALCMSRQASEASALDVRRWKRTPHVSSWCGASSPTA